MKPIIHDEKSFLKVFAIGIGKGLDNYKRLKSGEDLEDFGYVSWDSERYFDENILSCFKELIDINLKTEKELVEVLKSYCKLPNTSKLCEKWIPQMFVRKSEIV